MTQVLTKNDFSAELSTDKSNGLYAEFDKKGSLTYLAHHKDGAATGWVLTVDAKNYRGAVEKYERFPIDEAALAKLSSKEKQRLFLQHASEYCRKAIYALEGIPQCSFCGDDDGDGNVILCGPLGFKDSLICQRCLTSCADAVRIRQERSGEIIEWGDQALLQYFRQAETENAEFIEVRKSLVFAREVSYDPVSLSASAVSRNVFSQAEDSEIGLQSGFQAWCRYWAAVIGEEAQKAARCSFCCTSAEQATQLVAGPQDYICDGCISHLKRA